MGSHALPSLSLRQLGECPGAGGEQRAASEQRIFSVLRGRLAARIAGGASLEEPELLARASDHAPRSE